MDILQSAIDIRDEKNESQGNSAMRKVLDYIDENYYKETISLNEVADAVNMSANYLSAIFQPEYAEDVCRVYYLQTC